MRHCYFLVIGIFTFAVHAAQLRCTEDAVTNATQCIDMNEVREREGVRFAPIFTGGPNAVRKTSFTVHTNCTSGITHLKDRDGVSFAGGRGNETQTVKDLRAMLCEARLKGKR